MSALSRRSMMAGFATGMAVGLTPAVMATPVEFEDPAARIYRLGNELSLELEKYWDGRFRAIIDPASQSDGEILLERVSRVRP